MTAGATQKLAAGGEGYLAAPPPRPKSGNSLETGVGVHFVLEYKKAAKWVSLPCVLERSVAAVVELVKPLG